MAPNITPVVTRLLQNYKGARLNLKLPAEALADIGRSNPGRIGDALADLAGRHPNSTTNVVAEIGDQFVRTRATMKEADKVIGEISINGDASFVDVIRDFLLGGKKRFTVEKIDPKVAEKTLKVADKFKKITTETVAEKKFDTKNLDPRVLDKFQEFKG